MSAWAPSGIVTLTTDYGLRDPFVGIVTGLDYDAAGDLLKRARWNVKTAIVMQKTGLSWAKANARLREHENSMRDAIGEDIEPRLRQLLKLDDVASATKVEKA